MKKSTLNWLLVLVVAVAILIYIQNRKGDIQEPVVVPPTDVVEQKPAPVVLYGESDACMSTYEKAISDYHTFGFTKEEFDGDAVFSGKEIITELPFSGEVSVSYPTGYTYMDGAYSLKYDFNDGIVGLFFSHYLKQDAPSVLYITRPGDRNVERSGLQENMDNASYFDDHELYFFQQYMSQPPVGSGVTTCLIREGNDVCKYMYVALKKSENDTQYSVSCYIPTPTTMYSIISNAINNHSPLDTGALLEQVEWNNAATWLVNHIKISQ